MAEPLVALKGLTVDFDTETAQFCNFFQKRDWIQNDAIADHALASGPQHATGDELEHELLGAVDYRVSGVVSAGVPRHSAEAFAQHINNFAFTLVAPLGAQNYRSFRSHPYPLPANSHRLACHSRTVQAKYRRSCLRATNDSKPCVPRKL